MEVFCESSLIKSLNLHQKPFLFVWKTKAGKWGCGFLIGLTVDGWTERRLLMKLQEVRSHENGSEAGSEEEISNVEIIGNDVETKHIDSGSVKNRSRNREDGAERDAKRSDWVKGKRNQNLSFLRTKLCCIWISMLSWSLNSIFSSFSRARRVCHRLCILKVYQVALIAIHQMNCTSFLFLLSRSMIGFSNSRAWEKCGWLAISRESGESSWEKFQIQLGDKKMKLFFECILVEVKFDLILQQKSLPTLRNPAQVQFSLRLLHESDLRKMDKRTPQN